MTGQANQDGGGGRATSAAASAAVGVRERSPEHGDRSTRRWWRRRPPAGSTRFAQAVWWAGHLQLPIAVALLVVCLPMFVIESAGGVGLEGTAWVYWLGLAMAVAGIAILSIVLVVFAAWGLLFVSAAIAEST